MDTADGARERSVEAWLFETLSAVSRALTEATDAAELGHSLPTALTEPAENSAAWVGRPGRQSGTVRIRASSADLPDTLTDVDDASTERVLDSGTATVLDAEESSEYERLRDDGAVPAAGTAVVIPIPALGAGGVVHVYTDGDRSHPTVAETVTRIEGLLAEGFTHRDRQRELDRERQRLEELRSLVSHDLRNPINIAAGRLDLVSTECESEHISHVESALKRLESLADEGLLFVKAGRELDGHSALALQSIAEDCWRLIDDPDASLSVEPSTVYAEPERLRMLLNQLFENSVVHTEHPVTVSVGPRADERGFYVADDGPGIPADERAHVFDRGYTTVPERDGHGLALVEEIAGALGWAVELTEASGTRLEIRTGSWESAAPEER
jgi:signal transduction histidine kinase